MKSNIVQKNADTKGRKSTLIKVYYDGKCGLCSKEINHYKKIAPKGLFDWQDITKSDEDLKAQGISLAEGLKYLHVKDRDGTFYIGLKAFLLIWQQLKRWRFLAILLSWPVFHQIADWAYKAFARWRFNKLEHCQIAEEDNL